MRKTRNWKHITHNKKQYGTRQTTKYETPFMTLDVYNLKGDEEK